LLSELPDVVNQELFALQASEHVLDQSVQFMSALLINQPIQIDFHFAVPIALLQILLERMQQHLKAAPWIAQPVLFFHDYCQRQLDEDFFMQPTSTTVITRQQTADREPCH